MTVIHDSGTVTLFVSAGIYFWFQTVMTYKMWKLQLNSTVLFAIRIILASLYTVAFITFVAPDRIALKKRNQSSDGIKHSIGQWRPGDPGYAIRIVGDIAEWTTVFTLGAYFMTFFSEFQKITISVDCHEKQQSTGDEYKTGNAQYTTLGSNGDSDREDAKNE